MVLIDSYRETASSSRGASSGLRSLWPGAGSAQVPIRLKANLR